MELSDTRSLSAPQTERTTLLTELEILTKTSSTLKAEIEAYGASDPIKMEQKRRAIEIAKEACLLWTGERFLTFQWILRRDLGAEERGRCSTSNR